MKKRVFIISFICIGLALLLASGVDKRRAEALTLSSITNESIKQKESQISQAQDEKKKLQSGLTNMKNLKQELEKEKKNLKSYIEKLDAELVNIESNIKELKSQIADKEAEIEETEQELEEALAQEEGQREAMITRIRMVYESGDAQMIELLMKSKSFGDFLNKADYVEKVISYDQRRWQEYKTIREYVELCKQQLEIEKEILDETKAGVEEEQRNLEDLIEQKNRDIEAYEKDIQNKDAAIREYEAELKAQNEEIAALEQLIAQEKKSILASSGVVITYDGGAFKFPIASYSRVSDDYGDRIHPTLKVPQFHNGVDFAAPKGTAIYAAYDGVVVAATYSATMGNYVMIDHGDGLYTIYMHASSLYVKKDDIVVRGETIAAVGSTGRSTGNHLHFSVRKDGAYTSPWNYITK